MKPEEKKNTEGFDDIYDWVDEEGAKRTKQGGTIPVQPVHVWLVGRNIINIFSPMTVICILLRLLS